MKVGKEHIKAQVWIRRLCIQADVPRKLVLGVGAQFFYKNVQLILNNIHQKKLENLQLWELG